MGRVGGVRELRSRPRKHPLALSFEQIQTRMLEL